MPHHDADAPTDHGADASPGVARAIGLDEVAALWSSRAGRVLVASVGVILVATLVSLAVLWPRGDAGAVAGNDPGRTVGATVTAVTVSPCPSAGAGGGGANVQQCRSITVDPQDGAPTTIDLGPAEGGLAVERGDRVRVSRIPADDLPVELEGQVAASPYSLVGVDHTRALTIAAVLLAVLAVVALRLRGLLALAGVGLSLFLLAGFLVPAILAGSPPVLVALVGALAVMFVTVVLTNGVGAQSLAGALGIALTLVFTTIVGLVAVRFTGLDGSGSELSIVLAQASEGVSLEGVLLAGMVVGGLGVLADTAVTQASAVMALRHANPSLTARALYRRAVIVGRDHLSATIHTLVLAHAGATLPLLLVLNAGSASLTDTINNTEIAEPILATIIGCAGLIVAVPLSTALAALLVARIPVASLPESDGHGH